MLDHSIVPISIPIGQSGTILQSAALLYGWSLRETSGVTPAQLDLYDGYNQNGQLISTITLAANESTRDYLAGIGILCKQGLYANAVSGSVAGVVWVSGT